MIFEYSVVFISGLIVGSFLNVLIDRLPEGEDIIFKRSHCDRCGKTLDFLDLIPLISFLMLKGRCRNCGKKISIQNPIIEAVTGFLWVFVYRSGLTLNLAVWQTVYQWSVIGALLVIFITDIKKRIIPDQVIIFLIVTNLLYRTVFTASPLSEAIITGIFTGAFFFALVLLTRGKGMGMGDVKYALFMGLYLGWPKIVAGFYLAFLTGALVSLILVIRGIKTFKSTVAFGPFLVGATVASQYYGERIIFYFQKFFF